MDKWTLLRLNQEAIEQLTHAEAEECAGATINLMQGLASGSATYKELGEKLVAFSARMLTLEELKQPPQPAEHQLTNMDQFEDDPPTRRGLRESLAELNLIPEEDRSPSHDMVIARVEALIQDDIDETSKRAKESALNKEAEKQWQELAAIRGTMGMD